MLTEEKRREKRMPVNKYCSFRFEDQNESEWSIIQMKDISTLGIGIVSDDIKLFEGDKLFLRFSIMENHIECTGIIMNAYSGNYGVRFVDISDEHAKVISDFIC